MTTTIVLHIRREVGLPDNDQWTNRFSIKSSSSNRIYIVAQHKKLRHWGCSCPGWRSHRRCKHLEAMGLPGNEIPCEVLLT
jgi:hypothetical protein